MGALKKLLPFLSYFSVSKFKATPIHWFVLFIVMLPLFIGDIFRNILMIPALIYGTNKYTPVLIIAAIATWVVYLFMPQRRKSKAFLLPQILLCSFFVILVLIQNLMGLTTSPWIRLIEIVLPLYTALMLLKLLPNERRSYEWIVKKIFLVFIIYSLAFFFLWFFKTRFIFDVDPYLGFARFRTSLTGAVTFGQLIATIPLLFMVTFKKKHFLSNLTLIFLFLGLVYITGTRSALYAIGLTVLIILMLNRKSGGKILLSVFFFILILILLISFSDFSLDRYLITESSRKFSQIESLKITTSQLDSFLFGMGLSDFYPYEDFYKASQAGDFIGKNTVNTFLSGSEEILVEPHSTYIWIFTETGVIGFLLIISLLHRPLKRSLTILKNLKSYPRISVGLSLFCSIILISSLAGSFLINEPYVALMTWFLLFSIPTSTINQINNA